METDFITLGQNSLINEMHKRFSLDKYHEPSVSHAYSVQLGRMPVTHSRTQEHTLHPNPGSTTCTTPIMYLTRTQLLLRKTRFRGAKTPILPNSAARRQPWPYFTALAARHHLLVMA